MQAILFACREAVAALPQDATPGQFERTVNRFLKLAGGKFPEVAQTAYDSARAAAYSAGNVSGARDAVKRFLTTLPSHGDGDAGEGDAGGEGDQHS